MGWSCGGAVELQGDGAWREKQVFHPISDCQGAFPCHRTPSHPPFITNGLRARKILQPAAL